MIQNYKKHAQRGQELADTHSRNYDLSADAMLHLIQDSKEQPNGWYYAMLQEFYVGIYVGYKMAQSDQKQGEFSQNSPKMKKTRDYSKETSKA